MTKETVMKNRGQVSTIILKKIGDRSAQLYKYFDQILHNILI
jgi:hypothetical protein